MSERMVVVGTYSNEFTAALARVELEAAGIPVRVLSDGVGGLHPPLQFSRGIRVAVPESQAEYAREVLQPVEEAEEADEE